MKNLKRFIKVINPIVSCIFKSLLFLTIKFKTFLENVVVKSISGLSYIYIYVYVYTYVDIRLCICIYMYIHIRVWTWVRK